MLWLYYVTGIRVSEGLALYWSDIDFSKKTLRVHHNLIMNSKKDYTRSLTLKTENSKRIISLDDDTIKILKEWKNRQHKLTNSSFIMSYDGTPLHRCIVGRIINKYSKLAGVHKIQAKGLRHSHASYLINEHNADILVISKRLGHSSPEITLKHYSHLWGNNDRSIADMITGNINIKFSNESKSKFLGNQHISKNILYNNKLH
jgi:integrase family protein